MQHNCVAILANRAYLFAMISFRYLVPACVVFAALSACGDTGDFLREKYTGERYGDAVMGARRMPVLNPGAAKMAAPAAPSAVPVASAPPKAAPAPYDQYDNAGNEVGGTNYVKQWFGDKKPAPPAERKAFKGVVASADPVVEPEHRIPRSPELIPQAPPVKEVLPEAPEENGVMVPLPQQRSEAVPKEIEVSQLEPAAGGAVPSAYPHLSSVPKVPEQFKGIKAGKDATHQELQMQHDAAMEQKKRLSEEPTELPPTTLPQVEGMLKEIEGAIHGEVPIVTADARMAR